MRLIETLNVEFSKVEINKPLASLLMSFSLPFNELDKEELSISILRQNSSKPEKITPGFVSLKQFILANTAGNSPIGSAKDYGTQIIANLTTGGYISLNGNDLLKIEFQNLVSDEIYIIDGISSYYPAKQAFLYDVVDTMQELAEYTVDVFNYDLVIIPEDKSIDEYVFTDNNGREMTYSPFELRSILAQSFGISVLVSKEDFALPLQITEDFLQMPLIALSKMTLKKKKGTTISLLMRQKTLNL